MTKEPTDEERGEAAAAPGRPDRYDFRHPARVSKDRLRAAHAVYGVFARGVESWLTGRVRDSVTVELEEVRQLTFGEFAQGLPTPCNTFVLELEGPSESGQGALDLGSGLPFLLLDRLLGGQEPLERQDRALSELERAVVRLAADRIAEELQDAWADYLPVEVAAGSFEPLAEMLQIAAREDQVLVANLSLTSGRDSMSIRICIPFTVVEGFFTGSAARRRALPRGNPEERRRERTAIEAAVRAARVSVAARWPETRLPFGKVAGISPGTVIPLSGRPDGPVEVLVSGQLHFTGRIGRSGPNLAVRIDEAHRPAHAAPDDPPRATDDAPQRGLP